MSHKHADTETAGERRAEWRPKPPSVADVHHTRELPDDLVHITDLARYASYRIGTLARLIRQGKLDAWLSLGQVLEPVIVRPPSPVIPFPEPKPDGGAA